MKLKNYKHQYDYLVDGVEDDVIHGSQDSSSLVSSVKLINRNEFNIHCGVYKINTHIKYYLVKKR